MFMIRRRRLGARAPATVMLLLAAPLSVLAEDQPYFKFLGDLPGGANYSLVHGISADGSTVVGSSDSGQRFSDQAYYWHRDVGMKGLRGLDGQASTTLANAASGDGSSIVGRSLNRHAGYQATLWDAKRKPIGLPYLGESADDSEASDISADGKYIVGFSENARGVFEAVRWDRDGNVEGLGILGSGNPTWSGATCVSADGQIVAGNSTSKSFPNSEAFRSVDGQMIGLGVLEPYDKFDVSSAYGMSDDGSAIVGISDTDIPRAFYWTEAKGMISLGDEAGALAISGDGRVIGGYQQGVGAMLWDPQGNGRAVAEILGELGVELDVDLKISAVYGISADGLTLAGEWTDPYGDPHAWIARIPEPSTFLCLALTLISLIGGRRMQ